MELSLILDSTEAWNLRKVLATKLRASSHETDFQFLPTAEFPSLKSVVIDGTDDELEIVAAGHPYKPSVILGNEYSKRCKCPKARNDNDRNHCSHSLILSLLLFAELQVVSDHIPLVGHEVWAMDMARKKFPWLSTRSIQPESEFAVAILRKAPKDETIKASRIARQIEELHRDIIRRKQPSGTHSFYPTYIRGTDAGRAICDLLWGGQYLPDLGIESLLLYFDSPPKDTAETWSHFAFQATRARLTLPKYLLEAADLKLAEIAFIRFKERQELAQWVSRFERERHLEVAEPVKELKRLRVNLGPTKLYWEINDGTGIGFKGMNKDRVLALIPELAAFEEAELPNPPNSELAEFDGESSALLALLAQHFSDTTRNASVVAYNPRVGGFLAAALHHRDAAKVLFSSVSERPLEYDARRLRKSVNLKEDRCFIELVFDTGEPAPAGMLRLSGEKPSYVDVGTGKWFDGERMPSEEGNQYQPIEIPSFVARAPEFEKYVVEQGMEWPKNLATKLTHLSPKIILRVWSGTTGSVCQMKASLCADTNRGQCVEQLGDDGWFHVTKLPENTILRRAQMQSAQRTFYSLNVAWSPSAGCWMTTHETKEEMLDTLSAWLPKFPRWVEIEIDPSLKGADQPALVATRSLHLVAESEKQDWFNLQLSISGEDLPLTKREIEILAKANGGWVNLPKKGWRRMSVQDSPGLDDALESLGYTRSEVAAEGSKGINLHALQLRANEDLVNGLATEERDRLIERIRNLTIPIDAVPDESLLATLRPYQSDGLRFLAFLSANGLGGILADEQGLGKTIQALAWLLWLEKRKKLNSGTSLRVLIVCPKSVVGNWCSEAAAFAPSLPASAIAKSPDLPAESKLLVINYAQLRSNIETLGKEPWDAVILDEGQYIKNPSSATARAAFALPAENRLVLTGTPVENRLLDLWGLMHFAQPSVLGSQKSFNELVKSEEGKTDDLLRKRIRHFVLRRTKTAVAPDLPERIEKDIFCELTPKQQEIYDALFKEARQMLKGVSSEAEFNSKRIHVLAMITKLRQICCHPGILNRGQPDQSTYEEMSGKFGALTELLEPILAENEKVLIFSQFLGVIEMVKSHLDASSVGRCCITGSVSKEERDESIRAFQTDPSISAFLLSLKAGGSGINLTAANYVVLFDPWWNPAVEAQAIDRAHRIGQKKTVVAYRLIAKGTIEEKIRAMQRSKKAIADSVIKEEGVDSILDLESIKELFGV